MKALLAAIALTLFIGGCSAPQSAESGGAQEIKPGEKSIIQPPAAPQDAPSSKIEEKAL